jgi:hypothetical protein
MSEAPKKQKFFRTTRILGYIAFALLVVAVLHLVTFRFQVANGLEDRLVVASVHESMGMGRYRRNIYPRPLLNAAGLMFLSINGQDPSDRLIERFASARISVKKQSFGQPGIDNGYFGPRWYENSTGFVGVHCEVKVKWLTPFKASVEVIVGNGRASDEYQYVGIGPCWTIYMIRQSLGMD